jgi:mannose-6-phosphate isomerase
MMDCRFPLTLRPILKERVWGGTRLAGYGKTLPPDATIGESWEVADLPGDHSVVAAGPAAGVPLGDLVTRCGEALLGAARPSSTGGFPLLVKLLDARENLSVQVHPDQEYAAAHPPAASKTESWYVVEADPGSSLFNGVRPGVTHDDLAASADRGSIVDLLDRKPAVPGDLHHVAAGTVHALGAGVMVAEIQTPSDTTYRLYDWGAEHGRPRRELHITDGLASVHLDPPPPPVEGRSGPSGSRLLIDTDFYRITEHRPSGSPISFGAERPVCRIVLVASGSVTIRSTVGEFDELTVSRGGTAILPAGILDTAAVDAVDGTFLAIRPALRT